MQKVFTKSEVYVCSQGEPIPDTYEEKVSVMVILPSSISNRFACWEGEGCVCVPVPWVLPVVSEKRKPALNVPFTSFISSLLASHWLRQCFSISLMLWPCHRVPHVVVTPNHQIVFVATPNCRFDNVISCNVIFVFAEGLKVTCESLFYAPPPVVYDRQVENQCSKV